MDFLEEEQQSISKNDKFYKTFRIITNCVFVPFLILILISSVLMYKSKVKNEVPSLFGYSAVKILTGSMQPEFKEGDLVMVRVTNPSQIKIGDIIAFYQFVDMNADLNEDDLQDYDSSLSGNQNINGSTFFGDGASNTAQKQVAKYSKVIFHRVYSVRVNQNPNDKYFKKLFFQTKGDNNDYLDSDYWIMEDYVVGTYNSHNSFLSGFFSFCTSLFGIIILIIIPSLFLIAYLSMDFIREYRKVALETSLQKNKQIKLQKSLEEDSKSVDNNKKQDAEILTESELKLKYFEDKLNNNKQESNSVLNQTENKDNLSQSKPAIPVVKKDIPKAPLKIPPKPPVKPKIPPKKD